MKTKQLACLLALVGLVAAAARNAGAQAPSLVPAVLRSIAPNFARAGETIEVKLAGSGIAEVSEAVWSHPEINAELLAGGTATEAKLKLEIGDGVPPGIHRLHLRTALGSTGSVPFVIDPWAATPEKEPNDGAASASPVKLPATLTGRVSQPGDADSFGLQLAAGEAVTIEVIAGRIGSSLQVALEALDPSGQPVDLLHANPDEADPAAALVAASAGLYTLTIRDLENGGGGGAAYRLNLDQRPLVLATDPPVVPREGAELRLTGVHLGEAQSLRLTPAVGQRAVTVTEVSGKRLVRPVTIPVVETPLLRQVAGNEGATHLTWPVTAAGEGAGRVFSFDAVKGEPMVIETVARRAGSEIDTVIEILDATGNPLERGVVEAVAETLTTLNDRDSVNPGLRLLTWDEFNLRDLVYVRGEVIQLVALPRGPDDDARFRTIRGRRAGMLGTTPVGHALETPVYKVRLHPPGTSLRPTGLPVFPLFWRNDDGPPLYGSDSHLLFDPPATGRYQVRLTDALGGDHSGPRSQWALTLRPPEPRFGLHLSQSMPDIPAGSSIPVSVTVDRFDGHTAPISISLAGLPAGYSAASTVIEAGEEDAFILLTAGEGASSGEARLLLKGDTPAFGADTSGAEPSSAGSPAVGPSFTREIPAYFSLLPAGDLSVATPQKRWALRAGGEVEVEIAIERRNGFAERVPLEVRNMPFGVRVQDVGLNGVLITESETRRRFTLVAEPWVQPGTRLVFPTARTETGSDTPTEVSAPPVTLEILPAASRSVAR